MMVDVFAEMSLMSIFFFFIYRLNSDKYADQKFMVIHIMYIYDIYIICIIYVIH